jgi:hypothetical protein
MHISQKAVVQLEASLPLIAILNSLPLLLSCRVASDLHAKIWKKVT